MTAPSWYLTAVNEMGTAEVQGAKDNPRVVEYHQATGLKAKHDAVPWCAAFGAWCMKQNGIPYDESDAAGARNWLDDPNFKKLKTPMLGCVVILKRGGVNSTMGHLTFFSGWVDDSHTRFKGLGGNQSDKAIHTESVNIESFPVSDVLGYLWPKTTAIPVASRPLTKSSTIITAGTVGLSATGLTGQQIVEAISEHSGEVADKVQDAGDRISGGTIFGIVAGLLIILGIVYIIIGRVQLKRTEQSISESNDG